MATIPRPASLARVSIALPTGCLLVTAYLTVALRSQVDPVANVVSDYVFYHPGGALYVLAVVLLCAVFPTNRLPGDSSLSGDLHRVAGGTYFGSLPLAGWHISKALRADPRLRQPRTQPPGRPREPAGTRG
ncbi:hypothetical protein ACFFQW_38270 [Umezawaea endophytica]|uniref:Uncharacterized protein n=1 Tax=Umezawaea endophytica TaxID=1654476 RepID=A0A9X2VWQ9_9PSEU|nr:hypothetical protein [Umezawaea endophytica]MCS7483792.1 hypothetical protein [Umezawaea endophytica]